MRKQIIVVGLGQFGLGLVRALSQSGAEILAIDMSEKQVELASPWVSQAMCFDATDEESISQLQPEKRDVCVIATGDQSKEVGIICTALLKQLGAKRIIARANDNLHSRILRLVGAHEVVNPEWDFGERLAPKIMSKNILGEMTLDSKLVISEFTAPDHICGKTISELALQAKYSINVIAIKKSETGEVEQASANDLVEKGDILIAASKKEAIQNILNEETA